MKTNTYNRIFRAVVESYLVDGKALTIKEIAGLPNTPSESTIRKYIWDIRELDATTKDIDVRDTNYNWFIAQRRVDAFHPSRKVLADMIRDLRGEEAA